MNRLMHSPWPAVAVAGVLGFWGLGWGLPSTARVQLFLKPDQQNTAFYQKLEAARTEYYKKIGDNPMAYVGRVARLGQEAEVPLSMLSAYSSFILRTHHGDEQANLVMLSHLNPLKGKWYPHTYAYGGAYVYSLAAYLGVLHALKVIQLVPQAAFYYAQPEAMGKIFWAARSWSIIGLMLSVIPLFYIGKRLGGPFVAFWSSLFYALLPVMQGTAKMAKPHVWAAGWSLGMIYCGLRAREESGWKWLIAAAACYGFAMGTAVSQIALLPFLLWGCWQPSWKSTLPRVIVAGVVSVGLLLLTNFTVFAHFQDYRDEMFFLSQYSPFAITGQALWDFGVTVLIASYGPVLWLWMIVNWVYCLRQKDEPRLRQFTVLSLIVFAYVAFQSQILHGEGGVSRLALAAIGLGCVSVAWQASRWRLGNWICAACAGLLVAQALVYDAHFASDRVPRDNASLASAWITAHVPEGSTLAQTQRVPHVTEFPPLDFERYRIIQIGSPEFNTAKPPVYAVIPHWSDAMRTTLEISGFKPVRVFAESPLQKLGLKDPFTSANFAMEIYEKQ